MEWPEWFSWELEFTPHVLKRMLDRQFNEVDLREMFDSATDFHANHEEGRFVLKKHDGHSWEVIVEPLIDERILLVITAYPVG